MVISQEFLASVGIVSGNDVIIKNVNVIAITLILKDQTPEEINELIQKTFISYEFPTDQP